MRKKHKKLRALNERIRERLFPEVETYDLDMGGFTALPLILRRTQFLFNQRKWQVYTYIQMRTGFAGVAWLTMSEMSWDLDFKSIAKLKPYVDDLVNEGWVCRSQSRGRDYYILPDPTAVLRSMNAEGKIPASHDPARREHR